MSNLSRTETHNGYTYYVYDTGTTVAKGEIQNEKASRNGYIQQKAGGDSRQPGDHGGHLVPASQNGTPDGINIFAQDGKVNTRDVRSLERAETKAVTNGATIETERTAYCGHDPNRPDAFMFTDHVTMPDGTKTDIHSSFSNINHEEFENEENIENEEAADSYDAAKDKGLSKEEFYGILEDDENISDFDEGWISWSNPDANNRTEGTENTETDTEEDTSSSVPSSDDDNTEDNSDDDSNSNNDDDGMCM